MAVVALVLCALLTACGPMGSGKIVSEAREIGAFESIEVSGGIDLSLTVDETADSSVTVIYDDNLLDRIVTEIEGTTLVIRSRGSITILGEGRRVEVTTPVLVELSASGGCDVDGGGALKSLSLDASGGSDVDFSDLVVGSMIISASGGSDARVSVTDEIAGDVSGGSDVTILGDPANRRLDVSGGADVSNE
ncbi:MAG: GIN domain-containing protein [Acidimicrobiia bacterium]